MLKSLWAVLLFSILIPSFTNAVTRNVPGEYATIQSAIDAAVNGDTVLVAPGTYYENIDYRGKNIVVCSQYALTQDVNAIAATIINGSQPQDPDTGSCVLMISGEDTSAVLEGFTLTGGTGTRFLDQSNFLFYVEGGGIITEESTPTIKHNWIIGNQATRRPPNTSSAGGGGIRAGWSAPRIYNNLIMNNEGRYGGGVVLNYAERELYNNIIIQNSGGEDYGGGGLWLNGTGADTAVGDNNVICGNSSVLAGGGIVAFSHKLIGRNFIVWGNRANQGAQQISGATSIVQLTYSCVQGGRAGNGNIGFDPLFADSQLVLMPLSPCVDTGDSTISDVDNSRSDMGAYGGPGASGFPSFSAPDFTPATLTVNFGAGWPDTVLHKGSIILDRGAGGLYIDSVRVGVWSQGEVTVIYFPSRISPFSQDTVKMSWQAVHNVPLQDTLYIYHRDPTYENPARIALVGSIAVSADPREGNLPAKFALHQNYPNPFNAVTEIRFELPVAARVKLEVYDLLGNLVTTLLDGPRDAGVHVVAWQADTAASGVYLYRLRARGFQQERLMVLVK